MCTPSQPLYFCLLVPEFATQAILRFRTTEHTSPVVVVEGSPPLEKVFSFNSAAQRLGVERGLSRAELDSFPGLQVYRRSLPEEAHARTVLHELVSNFTPRFQNLSAMVDRGISTLLIALEMSGTEKVFGVPEAATRKVLCAVAELGFHARIATSANLLTAVCMARGAGHKISIVEPGHEAVSLSALSLAALAPEERLAETLSLWGIRFAGELANLAETALVARLGEAGRKLRQLARGEYSHLLVPEEPAFSLAEYVEFDSPVDSLDSLMFVLGSMLRHLLQRAAYRSLALASVTATLGLEGALEHVRIVKPALPLFDHALLLKLLQLDLQAHPPGANILTVRLSAEPGARSDVQAGLFTPQLPEPARLEVTLARLAALVGDGHVGRAVLLDTHAPEAFRMERFTVEEGGLPRKHSHRSAAYANTDAISAPERTGIGLRRVRPPAKVFVQKEGSSFCTFYMHGTCYTVHRAFGPWRRSGQWWTPEVWSREEWDVEANPGSSGNRLLCLLAHDLLHDTWHLEALYD